MWPNLHLPLYHDTISKDAYIDMSALGVNKTYAYMFNKIEQKSELI